MKIPFVLAIACFSASCTSPEQRKQSEIMDIVERKVRLPLGSPSLKELARAYKFSSPSRVVALYFRPDEDRDPSSCEEAKRGGMENGQIALLCPPPDGMKRDERRWFDDRAFLPDVLDGGCNYIDIEFEMASSTVISVQCHGEA